MSIIQKSITADELFAMGDIGRCELIYGEIVPLNYSSCERGIIAGRLGIFIGGHAEDHDLGIVVGVGAGFVIEDPDLVRAADAAFIRKDRLIRPIPTGYYPGVPDLAVEVMSPDVSKRDIPDKVNMWLAHGTSVVWLADPEKKIVTIHRVGKPVQKLTIADEIRDEPLLPEFVLPLSQIFKTS